MKVLSIALMAFLTAIPAGAQVDRAKPLRFDLNRKPNPSFNQAEKFKSVIEEASPVMKDEFMTKQMNINPFISK